VNIWRVDRLFFDMADQLGPFWVVVALAVLAYVAFGKLVRSLMTTIFVLVCTQVWWMPLHTFAHDVRFLLLIVLAVRGIVFVAKRPAPPGENRTARRVVAALGVLALASTIWSDVPTYTLAMSVSFCLGLFVIFGVLWRIADDPVVIPSIAHGAIVFSVIVFAVGPALAFVWTDVSGEYVWAERLHLRLGERYNGVFYNPNAAGLLGAMMLPVIVASPREFLGRISWLRVPVFAVTFATIFLSGSRSALIGSAMAVVILAMYRYGAGAFFTVGLGALAVSALAIYAPMDDADLDASAVGHIARTKHLSTLSGRLELWQAGWDKAQDHLILGAGWGMNRDIGGGVDLDAAVDTGQVAGAKNLHNAHLQLLIDVGFVGVALFWAFCWMVLRAGWRILVAPRSIYNGLALVLFTSALALIADTWVHGAIWSMGSPTTLAFWAVCALSLREGERAHAESRDARLPPWLRGSPPPYAVPATA
jgi:hypothetical protein